MSWTKMKLGDAATFINGYPFKPTDWKTVGKEIIRIQNLTGRDNDVNYFDGKIPEKYKVRKGDLLISWSATLGIFEWGREDAWLNQHIFKVVFNKIEFDKSFFKHLISTVLLEFGRKVHGSTMKHITKVNFDKTIISLPPLPEQKRIAEILDKADALRQKNKQLLATYDELLHATFLDMFGDPVTNPKGWEKKLIKDIGNVVTGNTPPRANPENYGNYIEWIKTDNISSEIIYPTNSREFLSEFGMKKGRVAPVGSILVTCIAGSLSSIGNCVITNREVAFNQQINAIIPKKCNSYFLYSVMQYSKKVTQDAATNGMKKLLIKSNFEKLTIIYPPITLQNQFAHIVENIEAQKTLVKQSLRESEDLFNGLVQKAFSGEL